MSPLSDRSTRDRRRWWEPPHVASVSDPEFYVFPMKVVKRAHDAQDARVRAAKRENKFHKTYLRDIPNLERYQDNWELVRKAVGLPEPLPPSKDEA